MATAPKIITATPSLALTSSQEGQKVARSADPANDPRMPDLVDKLMGLLCKQMPDLHANSDRCKTIEKTLRAHFGGDRHYIRSKPTKEQTAQEILSHFNGQNARTLARELGVGRVTVYRAVKQSRQALR